MGAVRSNRHDRTDALFNSGGIYVSHDMDSYRPLTQLFKEHLAENKDTAFLGRLPYPLPQAADISESSLGLPNSFMASTPNHPVWLYAMEHTRAVWYNSTAILSDGTRVQDDIDMLTGPNALDRAVALFEQQRKEHDPAVVRFPSEFIFPLSWYPDIEDPKGEDSIPTLAGSPRGEKAFDLEEARRKYNNGSAYACSYHASHRGHTVAEMEAPAESSSLPNSVVQTV